jgi:hypothetical protein
MSFGSRSSSLQSVSSSFLLPEADDSQEDDECVLVHNIFVDEDPLSISNANLFFFSLSLPHDIVCVFLFYFKLYLHLIKL